MTDSPTNQPSGGRTARSMGIGFVVGAVLAAAAYGLLRLVGASGGTATMAAFVTVMAVSIGYLFYSARDSGSSAP